VCRFGDQQQGGKSRGIGRPRSLDEGTTPKGGRTVIAIEMLNQFITESGGTTGGREKKEKKSVKGGVIRKAIFLERGRKIQAKKLV